MVFVRNVLSGENLLNKHLAVATPPVMKIA